MVAGASCWLVGWAGTQLWYFRRSRSVVSTRARSVKLEGDGCAIVFLLLHGMFERLTGIRTMELQGALQGTWRQEVS
jgi:hypothetical protein